MSTTIVPKIALAKDVNSEYGIDKGSSELGTVRGAAPYSSNVGVLNALHESMYLHERAGRQDLERGSLEGMGSVAKQNLNTQDRAKGTNIPFGPWAVEKLNALSAADGSKEPRPELGATWSPILAALAAGKEPSAEQVRAFAAEVKLEIAPMLKGSSEAQLNYGAGLVATAFIAGASAYMKRAE